MSTTSGSPHLLVHCVVFLQETVQSRKDVRTKERDELGQGIMPDTLKNWKVRFGEYQLHQALVTINNRQGLLDVEN